jgi:hypothetical protein
MPPGHQVPTPRSGRQDSQDFQPLVWFLDHVTGTLTVAGLVVYGLVRLGIDAFYSRLGVTAEDVGLTYAATLSRAALGLLVAFVAALLAVGFASIQTAAGYYFASLAADQTLSAMDDPNMRIDDYLVRPSPQGSQAALWTPRARFGVSVQALVGIGSWVDPRTVAGDHHR